MIEVLLDRISVFQSEILVLSVFHLRPPVRVFSQTKFYRFFIPGLNSTPLSIVDVTLGNYAQKNILKSFQKHLRKQNSISINGLRANRIFFQNFRRPLEKAKKDNGGDQQHGQGRP